ncbi:GIY-YIG nuclease family protein [Steroidobacter flavus]|uniref:GIY-YIG nuclease family protein n=1 Tax=Steroidobacter flavus TaxID=1842136 RepID=A0ABV8T561_9GAMM
MIVDHMFTHQFNMQMHEIDAAVSFYHANWRHPDLYVPTLSPLYSLFPSETHAVSGLLRWPSSWPNADSPGVYLIFAADGQLLYVGKSRSLGTRLDNYFRYSNGRGSDCHIVDSGWHFKPCFVATIPLLESFEAAGLEEFLIDRLDPWENKHGSRRDPARFLPQTNQD